MGKHHTLRWRELIWLLALVLVLVALGVWEKYRQPFALVIDNVQAKMLAKPPSMQPQPRMRDVQVEVLIAHQGSSPHWWGESCNADLRVYFAPKGENDDGFTNEGFYPGVVYDSSIGKYRFLYKGKIPNHPHFLETSTCRIYIKLKSQEVPSIDFATARASLHLKRSGDSCIAS